MTHIEELNAALCKHISYEWEDPFVRENTQDLEKAIERLKEDWRRNYNDIPPRLTNIAILTLLHEFYELAVRVQAKCPSCKQTMEPKVNDRGEFQYFCCNRFWTDEEADEATING